MSKKIIKIPANKQILQDASYISTLERKAALLDELLSFFEDKAFGYLIEETESETSLTLDQAEKILKSQKSV